MNTVEITITQDHIDSYWACPEGKALFRAMSHNGIVTFDTFDLYIRLVHEPETAFMVLHWLLGFTGNYELEAKWVEILEAEVYSLGFFELDPEYFPEDPEELWDVAVEIMESIAIEIPEICERVPAFKLTLRELERTRACLFGMDYFRKNSVNDFTIITARRVFESRNDQIPTALFFDFLFTRFTDYYGKERVAQIYEEKMTKKMLGVSTTAAQVIKVALRNNDFDALKRFVDPAIRLMNILESTYHGQLI